MSRRGRFRRAVLVPLTISRFLIALPVKLVIPILVFPQCGAIQSDARKQAARARPGENLPRSYTRVGLRWVERPTDPGRYRGISAQREFRRQQPFHALSFITSMKTSISEPPIWKPTLPPSIRIEPGADQPTPPGFRHVTNPLPYLPPTTKAAFLRSGNDDDALGLD